MASKASQASHHQASKALASQGSRACKATWACRACKVDKGNSEGLPQVSSMVRNPRDSSSDNSQGNLANSQVSSLVNLEGSLEVSQDKAPQGSLVDLLQAWIAHSTTWCNTVPHQLSHT